VTAVPATLGVARAPRRPLFTVAVLGTAWTLLALHAVLSLGFLPWTLLFDPDRRRSAQLGSWLARSALHWPPTWRGAARSLSAIRLDRPTVVVMNHRSIADTALAVAMPGSPKIVAKSWAGRVPVLGLCMRLCGHLLFEPSSPRSVRFMMAEAERHLLRGNSVLFFPEGSRQPGAALGRFQDGAFHLAVRTGADVLPVVLHGMGDLVPRGSVVFRDAAVAVTPLARIPAGTDRRALSERVREAMAASIAAWDGRRSAG
jgi:1-acyl-sn-glycerol-3-phosphate acyltransferase